MAFTGGKKETDGADIIVFDSVSKLFPSGGVGLEDTSLRVRKGEFVFVTGRSGAGKSTLLKLIGKQTEPTGGRIWVGGRDLGSLTKKEVPYYRRRIGVMQPDLGLLADHTIFENVALAMKATEQSGRGAKKRVEQILKIMGIEKRAGHYPHEVSMGEGARAMLARAMILNPSILLADEPTANLDPDTAWDMMCLIDEWNRMGVTVVMASHNRELVSIMRKRVVTLSAGRVVADERHAVYNTRAADAMEERRILNERMGAKT